MLQAPRPQPSSGTQTLLLVSQANWSGQLTSLLHGTPVTISSHTSLFSSQSSVWASQGDVPSWHLSVRQRSSPLQNSPSSQSESTLQSSASGEGLGVGELEGVGVRSEPRTPPEGDGEFNPGIDVMSHPA